MSIARAAYEAYPDSALTNAALGSALFASGNVKDAEAFLRSAIAKQDVQPECIFLLGRLLDYLGKESEARELAAKLKAHMDDVNVFVTRRAAEKWVAQTLN